jgi:hypothetical protein
MNLLRTILFSTCWILGSLSAQSQETDTIIKDGVSYYVYPFRVPLNVHTDYWHVVKDKAFFEDYNNYFDYFNGDILFNRESFMKAKSPSRRKILDAKLKKQWAKQRRRRSNFVFGFKKTIRKNPKQMFNAFYSHELDVLPPFELIPDGKYVQLYDDVCVVDVKGMCQPNSRQIAGYFTIKNNAIDGEAFWLSTAGDTLKKGLFVNGEKQGRWDLYTYSEMWYNLTRFQVKTLRKTGKFDRSIDTSF